MHTVPPYIDCIILDWKHIVFSISSALSFALSQIVYTWCHAFSNRLMLIIILCQCVNSIYHANITWLLSPAPPHPPPPLPPHMHTQLDPKEDSGRWIVITYVPRLSFGFWSAQAREIILRTVCVSLAVELIAFYELILYRLWSQKTVVFSFGWSQTCVCVCVCSTICGDAKNNNTCTAALSVATLCEFKPEYIHQYIFIGLSYTHAWFRNNRRGNQFCKSVRPWARGYQQLKGGRRTGFGRWKPFVHCSRDIILNKLSHII